MKQVRLARRPVSEMKSLEKSVNDWLTINADKTVYDIRFQPIECGGSISLFVSIVYEAEEDKA
ncbi:MAG: hypothetical protein IJ089_02475 [Clostridia bacterium]|nr:hypothetical protein [Clostridia bacterium]